MTAIALTQQLVQFDTRNPSGREADCARFLTGILREPHHARLIRSWCAAEA